ncbi:atrial natriuretic peptide receptor 2-like [Lampetra planeri]
MLDSGPNEGQLQLGALLLLLWARVAAAWHDLDNLEYDCWPLAQPNEFNMIDCGGLEMAWLRRPPLRVASGHEFEVTYLVTASPDFYDYAVRNHILRTSNNVSEAMKFCDQECPSNWNDANEDNCCIHHANIHSCPLSFMNKGGICGPWIPDDGQIFTHTLSSSGTMSQRNWTGKVTLAHVGVTSLIAHIRVGHMQAALEATTTVLPATVCGDGVCGQDETCSTCPADCGDCPMSTPIKVAIGLPISLFFSMLVFTLLWFEYQKHKLFWDESWIVSPKDIKMDYGQRGAEGSLASMRQPPPPSDTTASHVTDLQSAGSGYTQTAAVPSHCITIGVIYQGNAVAMKRINKKTFSLTKTIRSEVKEVRELEHPNLCRFVGAVVDEGSVALLTEFCPKGSLRDVLLNDEIPLNWGFRLSFAVDIVRGMSYLHQHRLVHGRLKPTNCLVDDRWVCKIADYGLEVFRTQDKPDEEVVKHQQQQQHRQGLASIYMAPERLLLRHGELTSAVDVYSFGVILVEIATRSEPTPDMDVNNVDSAWRPSLPQFSGKTDTNCPSPTEYCELIQKCWAQNPLQRPSFEQAKKQLHKMNPNKVSPVDMMMMLMERYSKHLESVVAERTQDLVLEKQKTDRLLYSMLPRKIADDLRQGKVAKAQSYASATIFFSDIVGFTQLSGASTPYQVVDFLNKLYTTFDDIIDSYDVYKVETIGDAYMVVSGVPHENGNRHASEIANLALDLVAVCRSFVIPHQPHTRLRIRAGIHSGSVVAGVVGTKMPRYCLFGDTVNTASRMESTSEALKIQVTLNTRSILETIGGYFLTCRGTITIKGKGDMVTWWLEGRETPTPTV